MLRKVLCRDVEQSGYGLLGRTIEECIEQMAHCRLSCLVSRNDGNENIAEIFFLVTKVFLLFEKAQGCANGGVTWRVGKGRVHFRCGSAAQPIDNVHDLALAAAEPLLFF